MAVKKNATTTKVEKKPVAKKAVKEAVKEVAKKPAKAPVKKAEKKPAVVKKSAQDYKDVINWKKWEAHNMRSARSTFPLRRT